MSKGSSTSSKVGHFFKAPIRLLGHARDLYVDTMMGCATRVDWNLVGGFPGAMPHSRIHGFTRPRTATSDVRDIGELIRAASLQSLGPLDNGKAKSKDGVVPKSPNAVSIGRIDEDLPCIFEDDVKVVQGAVTRRRSCAMGGRRRVGVLD